MDPDRNLKIISKYIFEKPEIVVKILNNNGVSTSKKVTLNEIVEKTFKAIHSQNKGFIDELTKSLNSDGYLNFAGIAIGAGLSIASSIFGSNQAKKARELQTKIAIAQMETDKLLALEELRVYGETERTRILANTLQKYRSDLQTESTARQKNVYVYLIALGLGISIIYSSTILIKAS